MGYFPFFIDIGGKPCTVIGGGKVALRKIEKLMPFGPKIKVVAPVICHEIESIEGLELIRRKFSPSDIDGAFFVISATDDKILSADIYSLCTGKNIPVNTVDDQEKCTFIFPAIVKKGDAAAAVSTSGKSPMFARFLRENIEELMSDKNMEIMDAMGRARNYIKANYDTEEQRCRITRSLLEALIACDTVPDDDTIHNMIESLTAAV